MFVTIMPVLAALWVALSVGQPAATPAGDVADLQRLEAEWNAAHMRGDAAALDKLFADDLVVQVPGMRVMSKSDSLGMFASGRMKFDRYESSEISVRVYGDTAVVTGRIHRTRTNGGNTYDDDWRFTKVYLRKANRWQVVSFHASNAAP